MKKAINYLLFSMLLANFCACYSPRYLYSAEAHNVPVLLKKGDSKIAFNYSTNLSGKTNKDGVINENKSRGTDLQGAYAITNHLAIQASYTSRTEKNTGYHNISDFDTSVINYKRNLTTFGIGYFASVAGNYATMFQVFGGAGIGNSSFTDLGKDANGILYNRFHKMNMTKIYLQPAITVRTRHNFSSSLSSRFTVLYLSNIQTDYTVSEKDIYQLTDVGKFTSIFWEPAFVNNFGFKKLPGLQLEFQMGMAFLATNHFIDYRTFNFSAGIVLDIPKFFPHKPAPDKN